MMKNKMEKGEKPTTPAQLNKVKVTRRYGLFLVLDNDPALRRLGSELENIAKRVGLESVREEYGTWHAVFQSPSGEIYDLVQLVDRLGAILAASPND